MKKAITLLILSLVVLVAFGTETEAQIPKEGTGSMTFVYSGTYKALPMGQERLQMSYEIMGVIIGDTSDVLFHNASVRCLGALHAVKGESNNNGFCVGTRPDGDQIFWTYQSTGKLGAGGKGTSTLVGGTGKLTGIQGSSEYTDVAVRPAAEGTFQGYSRIKGQYKLP
ncbi:MAG: hypothetical protein ABSH06_30415 [Thermodesulfobacteriota bacterium]|jgi:hypothetical protein